MDRILKKHRWAILYLALIFIAAGFVLYRSVFNPANPEFFEIVNFSGQPEIYQNHKHVWGKAQRGHRVGRLDKIKTDDKSDIDFRIPGEALFRLKNNSQLQGHRTEWFEGSHGKESGILLEEGVLLVHMVGKSKESVLTILSPSMQVVADTGSVFLVELDKKSNPQSAWIGVLRGKVEVASKAMLKNEKVTVESLEKLHLVRGEPVKAPEKISQREWGRLNEGYELMERAMPLAQDQLDLSKDAGTLFDYVFDHGTFYTPSIGYANREFFRREDSGAVELVMDYDVFPTSSFVGMYLKVRDLDVSKFQNLEFEVRRVPDSGFPEDFKIELKATSGIMKSFQVSDFKNDWRLISLPLNFENPTLLTEITLVFSNSAVGEFKKGALQFRNLNLKPR